jgi:DNA-directed RNA polymerase II subunit RPB1
VNDIYNCLGVEAARKAIMKEIRVVLEFFTIYVNYRHISMLADVICMNGKFMAISRNGINRIY